MPAQQIDKRISFFIVLILALVAGPIGWFFLIIWLFKRANSPGGFSGLDIGQSAQPAEKIALEQERQLGQQTQAPLASSHEWGRIILLVILIITLISLIFYYYLK